MTDTPRSRFAVKSIIPPTQAALQRTSARLPQQNSPTESADDWHDATTEFLAGKPIDPVAAHAATVTRPDLIENFRHSGWAPTRKRVDAALASIPEVTPRRLAAFRCCGSDAYVEEFTATHSSTPCDYRVRSTKCHDRFCVPCSNERSMRIRDSLTRHMYKRPDMSLITLTFAASDEELTSILDRAHKCFRLLRSWCKWKKAVKGGAAIIETKIGTGSGKWHVHFHVLAEMKFLSTYELSDKWLAITGDSKIVDIRRVGAICGAVSYITKYVTKAADPSLIADPKRLQESILAFTGRRLVSTFGTWRGLQLMERPEDEKATDAPDSQWRTIGSLDAVILAAARGDPKSLKIMQRIAPRRFVAERPKVADTG